MFCNSCGSPIAPEQSICSNCGRSTTGARVALRRADTGRRTRHLLAILWFVLGAFFLVPAVIMGVLAAVITVPLVSEELTRSRSCLRRGCSLFCALFSWHRRPFGLSLDGACSRCSLGAEHLPGDGVLRLICPPFDTALGIYTLFVLLPDAAGDEYRQMSQTRG